MQAVQPCMRKASVRECETDWVCLFATHSCLRRSSLLLLLLPSSWHQCEYPADDVTTSPRGPDDAQSQARFPHKPLKHQNNLLSYWACVRDGMFEGTRGAVPLRSGWPQFMWSQFPIKHTFHSCLPPPWLLYWVCSCWHLIARTSVDLNVASWIRTRSSLCRRRFMHLYAIYSCVLSLWWENKTLSFTLPLYWSTCSIVILRNSSRSNITEWGFHFAVIKNKHPITTARRADASLKGLFAYSPKEFCDSSEFPMITRWHDRVNRSH